MTKLDDLIEEALSAEERALMEEIGEPHFFGQLFGQFRGPDAWVNWLSTVGIFAFGALAIWSGWAFFTAPDVMGLLRGGLICLASIMMIGMIKLYFLGQMQTDRVIRELKRVELMLAARK